MSPRVGKNSPRADTAKKANGRTSHAPARSAKLLAGLDQSHLRLQHLYAISKLFTNSEGTEQPLDPALGIIAKTLPLRSAILIQIYEERSQMIVWASEGQRREHLRAVKTHAQEACNYLVGVAASDLPQLSEQAGNTPLPQPMKTRLAPGHKFIVIPLVMPHRPPFGVLQLEGAQPLDETDLMFVNAIANQLAIALDRDHAWRRDITRREYAEERQNQAEITRAAAERARVMATESREKYAALAAENSELYEHAQRAVRAREQILAIVSHDLKNPLGTILLTTGLLRETIVPGETPRGLPQAIGRIHRSAESMLRLIDDLLDFASIEAGQLAIKISAQDAASLMQATFASFESVAQAKRLRLGIDLEAQPATVSCDRGRILQVLSNLVSNAINVTETGEITLGLSSRGHEVVFAVSDTGPGISAEDATHLFERYWRSGDTGYKGTGLGLAIARGIIRAHAGKIWVESELGRGTTFLFTLARQAGVAN